MDENIDYELPSTSKTLAAEDGPSSKRKKTDVKVDKGVISTTSKEKDKEDLQQDGKNRNRNYKKPPYFKLKFQGDQARLSTAIDQRMPIFLHDFQNLILYVSLGHSSYFPHRWCSIERLPGLKHAIILVVENLSLLDYTNNKLIFPNVKAIFPNKVEIVTPGIYKGDLIEELMTIPAITTRADILTEEYGTLKKAITSVKACKMLKAVFPVKNRNKHTGKMITLPESDKFPRTHLLLSARQLLDENYPIPLSGELKKKYANYIMSKDVYEDVTEHSPLFGLDCEMCRTTSGALEVTRVTVVDERHEIFYEKLVKPRNEIVDYLTQYSGITEKMLENVTTRIEEVQQNLKRILPPDAILVGQSLNADLHALKFIHPYIIDTSVIYNTTGDRQRKSKLKDLTQQFLNIAIQTSELGHNSKEDSISSLKLVQLKLQHCVEFGDAVHLHYLKNFNYHYNYFGTSLLHHITKIDKNVQIISQVNDMHRFKAFIHKKGYTKVQTSKITCVEKKSNNQIIDCLGESSKNSYATFAHIKISDEAMYGDKFKRTCETVDYYMQKMWQDSPINTIFLVLFGGNSKANGAGFINIKKGK